MPRQKKMLQNFFIMLYCLGNDEEWCICSVQDNFIFTIYFLIDFFLSSTLFLIPGWWIVGGKLLWWIICYNLVLIICKESGATKSLRRPQYKDLRQLCMVVHVFNSRACLRSGDRGRWWVWGQPALHIVNSKAAK